MAKTITTEDFDSRVKTLGRVRRVDQPDNCPKAAKPLLFECLQHRERHRALPTNILRGQGLSCCKAASQTEVAAKKRELARTLIADASQPRWSCDRHRRRRVSRRWQFNPREPRLFCAVV
jgi:hypothetical protein